MIGGALSSAAYSQEKVVNHPDFGYILGSDPWLTSENASGLYRLQPDNVSYAELSFTKDNGKFINYFQSGNSYTYGAKAESFYRLSPRTVVYGKVSYDNFEGKNMGGSSFIDPYYNPFNIVAESDETAGDKQMERYHLVGALSVDVYKGLNLGGKIDYTAANYAKFRDLRHKNKLTDLSLTVGASYPLNRTVELGLNYYYRRTVEGIEFATYGNRDVQYYSLIDFGAFFGRREVFGDTGYTQSQDDKPVFNQFHGVSAQIQFNFSPGIKLFNEFTYRSRDGYFGKQAPRSIVYTEHNGTVYRYRGVLSIRTTKNLHTVELSAGKEKLDNNENIYNSEDPNSDVVYYGANRVLDQNRINAELTYTANLNVSGYVPQWVLKSGVNYYQQNRAASLFPYYRKQTINTVSLNLQANRNIFASGNQIYKVQLGGAFGTGSGTEKNDGLYTGEPGGSTPVVLDNYLHREYEYFTSPRFELTTGFGYQRPVNNNVSVYGNIQYQVTKGFNIVYLSGSMYHSIGIKLGCYF